MGKVSKAKEAVGSLGDWLLGNIQEPRNVFPAPQRMFDPNDKAFKPFLGDIGFTKGGRYLEMGNGAPQDITGQFVQQGVIGVDPTGKPIMQVSKGLLDSDPQDKGRSIKTNLFKKKAGWNWTQVPEGYDPNPDGSFPLVSVEDGPTHYYVLNAEFPEGMDLKRYPNSASEPRLRPTKKGKVHLGNQVGEISVRGKLHPVYDRAQIFEMATPIAGGILGQMLADEQDKGMY